MGEWFVHLWNTPHILWTGGDNFLVWLLVTGVLFTPIVVLQLYIVYLEHRG